MKGDPDLRSKLERWASNRGILPTPQFSCPHYCNCQASRERQHYPPLDREKTCMMSYVGRCYGQSISGMPFRLAIVGMDHGDHDGGDFTTRQSGIEDWYYRKIYDRWDFNQHYNGVIRTAAAIMGQAGQFCLDNCWRNRECAAENRPSTTRCVLLSFAQPNLVKCASANNRKCLATTEMYNYCSSHLVYELEVLVVVFHGRPARRIFPKAVRNEGGKLAPLEEGPRDEYGPVIYDYSRTGFQSCFVLFLKHPSYNHLQNQWRSVVEPALEWLRSQRAIPA